MTAHLLAIDQGTTSTRALVFRQDLSVAAVAQQEFPQYFPRSGYVEHDPEEIWSSVVATCREAIARAGLDPRDVAAIGIANQRETAVVWDRATGRAIHNAIVWQDRRTADACAALAAAGHEAEISARTGLLLDPYFSATKIAWILDNVAGAREAALAGRLAFGTVDSFLLWRLTGGRVHATDATNASRSMLYDIVDGRWSEDLCDLLRVPMALLPEVRDCAAPYGATASSLFGAAIPITGIAGDQQAATVGQACFRPGMMKSTYGTGCFALLNIGPDIVRSRHRLLTTLAYQLGGQRTYALEGSIFVAGAAVQWLRDGLGLIAAASEADQLAAAADPTQRVYLVPAFVGLGAPYWDAECRGTLTGLTRATTRKELARAALDSLCLQTRDLLEAMRADGAMTSATTLRVDGGMVASDWTMQRLADVLAAPVDRPTILKTTALGAAYLAGLQAGLLPAPEDFAKGWMLERRFEPRLAASDRETLYAGWKQAVAGTLTKPAH